MCYNHDTELLNANLCFGFTDIFDNNIFTVRFETNLFTKRADRLYHLIMEIKCLNQKCIT